MYPNPWDPIADAILDFYNGDHSATVRIYSDFEDPSDLPASHFFREPDAFVPLENTAVGMCRGNVLDIGAGAGCHSLALQEMGRDVTAVEIAPRAVEVMIKRGVRNVVNADIFRFHAEQPFDTLLMLMNGIGIAGDLKRLSKFFDHARTLIKPDGNLIFDSVDLRLTCSESEIKTRELDREYFGIIRYQAEYRGRKGPCYEWLYIDSYLMADIAQGHRWLTESIFQENDGHYLAVLSPEF